MKNLPYFYIIRHKASKVKYAGSKRSKFNSDPSTFMTEKGYKTSSKIVRKIIEEEGLESFEILDIITQDELSEIPFCTNDVYLYETYFLRSNNCSKSPEWFNKHNNNWANSDDCVAKMVETRKNNNSYTTGAKKGAQTRKNILIEGIPLNIITARKIVEKRKTTFLENGLTVEQESSRKRVEKMRNVDINGETEFIRNGKKISSRINEKRKTGECPMRRAFLIREERGREIDPKTGKTKREIWNNKLSEHAKTRTGSKNPNASLVEIFNSSGVLMFTCNGDFRKVCKENNLPAAALNKSYKNAGTPIFVNPGPNESRIKTKGYWQYRGWFAKLITK